MNSPSFNHLKDENSAYLRQHAQNPVNWYPYGPEALQLAKDHNKPIFLSIGYSSCHWCHVMADESFKDKETAHFLNKNFISIKVDKEEHPDIDQYYQQACQLFIKTGGWPLSAFLLPDMRPFFVGTYYPKEKRGDAATFLELLNELHRAFTEDKEQVETNATNVTEALKKGLDPGEPVEFKGHFPPPMAILDAVKEFADLKNGGYGQAPKFPHFSFYEWAVEQILEGMIDKEHGQHIIDSIEKMLMGGMHDHAKGGIHRYSTDDKFLVPHFEKMLYDQAGLLRLLSKASLIYPSPIVFDCLINTLDYIKGEMQHEKGYFFSAQDADSEGVEGLYFSFSKEEFENILISASEDDDLVNDKEKITKWFQIEENGNFQQGLNVISLNTLLKEEIFTPDAWDKIRRIRKQVLEERKQRIPPATDNKGIASWNAMMISSLVDVMQFCQVDIIKRKASDIFNTAVEGFYETFLQIKEGKGMMIRHSTTRERSLAYLEDFTTFAESMLRVYEITGNTVFKQNFKDTFEFILNEFIQEGEILTRAKSLNEHELYPNQASSPFDSSFKAMPMTLVHLVKRARILSMDPSIGENIDEYIENSKNFILKNPINGGEGLRAHSYPTDAYRLVKAPKGWLQNGEFIKFMSYFLPRFVFDYHEEKEEKWEICSFNHCELQGEGLEAFQSALKPKANPDESKS